MRGREGLWVDLRAWSWCMHALSQEMLHIQVIAGVHASGVLDYMQQAQTPYAR